LKKGVRAEMRTVTKESEMVWTAWKNREHARSGTSYGFRVSRADRDRVFEDSWSSAMIDLSGAKEARPVEVILKASFWDRCPELVSQDIRQWFFDSGLAPWEFGHPPKFMVRRAGGAKFIVEAAMGT